MSQSGVIFNIQRNCIHDGPGIRTSVFIKGCPLRCQWCCNPESQTQNPELAFLPFRCVACGRCMEKCPERAIHPDQAGRPVRDHKLCVSCGMCVSACPHYAWKHYGKWMSTDEVFDEVLRDELFYRISGGGVTFTGGEPMGQREFLRALLKCGRYHGIHTALQTCGYASEEYIESIFPLVDLFLMDLKHMDSAEHQRLTGVGNELILANIRWLSDRGAQVVYRIPLVPGYNDTSENMHQTGQFVKLLGAKGLILLAFHQLGAPKYNYLQADYMLKDKPAADEEAIERAKCILEQYVDKVTVGGGE